MRVRWALAGFLGVLAGWGVWYLVVKTRNRACNYASNTTGCETLDDILLALGIVFPLLALIAAVVLLVALANAAGRAFRARRR